MYSTNNPQSAHSLPRHIPLPQDITVDEANAPDIVTRKLQIAALDENIVSTEMIAGYATAADSSSAKRVKLTDVSPSLENILPAAVGDMAHALAAINEAIMATNAAIVALENRMVTRLNGMEAQINNIMIAQRNSIAGDRFPITPMILPHGPPLIAGGDPVAPPALPAGFPTTRFALLTLTDVQISPFLLYYGIVVPARATLVGKQNALAHYLHVAER